MKVGCSEDQSRFVNPVLDRLARTHIELFRHHWPAFQVCGYTGLVFAIALGFLIVSRAGLSQWVIGVTAISAMLTFLALALATKIITGQEQLIYYHHEIAIMMVSALVSNLMHRPALPYLDVTILGVGTFLAFGRIGCLMVGCCHGRPSAFGIRYHRSHALEGFTSYLVGVRLFPIQAVEAICVFLVVIGGSVETAQGRPPGTAFALYTIGYGFVRFNLEFFRGDTDRPYSLGFSQGQWISLWLMFGVVAAEISGQMAFHWWHLVATAALPLSMLVVVAWRKIDSADGYRIHHPQHVSEVADAVDTLTSRPTEQPGHLSRTIPIACTSMGFHISAGDIQRDAVHFTISRRGSGLTTAGARNLAKIILQLKPGAVQRDFLPGREEGVFHLVLSPAGKEREAA